MLAQVFQVKGFEVTVRGEPPFILVASCALFQCSLLGVAVLFLLRLLLVEVLVLASLSSSSIRTTCAV